MKDTILFGKYQLVRILGQGRSGIVYLAFHQELQEYRAIKQVSKSAALSEQFRKEALLIRRLRHPGIPIVYDLEEDSQFSYLVEEFLEGDSLYDLVNERGPLNQDAAIMYGIQICGLVHYLHSAEAIPILHLDLQPRNLLVCHGQVKLLDFDHSDTLSDANEMSQRFGTAGFSAPEQRDGAPLGVYTDIYQIGAVLYYMTAGRPLEEGCNIQVPGQLGAIIRRCLNPDAASRYASAGDVEDALCGLSSNTECLSQSHAPALTVALAGARAGVGVTHIAVGLAVWLNRTGRLTLYEEHNHSNDVRAMGELMGTEPDSYGICTIRKLPMMPRYGEAVRLKKCSYPVIVRDYGTELEAAARDWETGAVSCLFLVCGGKWWDGRRESEAAEKLRSRRRQGAAETPWEKKRRAAAEKLRKRKRQGASENGGEAFYAQGGWEEEICFLYNHVVPGAIRLAEGRKKDRCFRVPDFTDPFRPNESAESFFRAIMAGRLPETEEKPAGLWKLFGGSGRSGS